MNVLTLLNKPGKMTFNEDKVMKPKSVTTNLKSTRPTLSLIKLVITSCVLSLFITAQAMAVTGKPDWVFHDAIPDSNQEAVDMVVDSQGNLIITGYSDVSGNLDYYTIKISPDGQTMVWPNGISYNNASGNGDDWPVAVAVDAYDDVFVTGFSFNGNNYDIVTIKYRGTDGSVVWEHSYQGNPSDTDYLHTNDYPLAMAVSGDSLYVAGFTDHGGSTGEDAVLFKLPSGDTLNGDGLPTWLKTYNEPTVNSNERFNSVTAGPNGIAVTGFTALTDRGSAVVDDYDILTIKYDEFGNIVWQHTYDNGYGEDAGQVVKMDSAGNVVVTAKVMGIGHFDIHTIKLNAAADVNGDPVVAWSVGYDLGDQNAPYDLAIDSNDDIYITGYTSNITGLDDIYTAKILADGTPQWDDVFDSGTDNLDIGLAVAVDNHGGVFVTGYTSKAGADDDFMTIKYHADTGNQLWFDMHNAPAGGNDQPSGLAVGVAIAPTGQVYVGGWSSQDPLLGGDLDYYALLYDSGILNAPTGLTTSFLTSPQPLVRLTWHDNSANEDKFCIDRCDSFDCSDFTELICTQNPDETTIDDLTVSPDTWYSYRVRAFSATDGDSLPSNEEHILTTEINYPPPSWLYVFDGEGLDDKANAIAIGSDNHPVVTGMSASVNSQYDYYTVKLDRDTALPRWADSYDGPDGQGDMGICLAVDNNNEIIVSGFSSVNAGQGINTNDIFTIKYAANGPDQYTGYPLWTDQYNGPGNDDDRSEAIATAADGSNNTVVTGYGLNAPVASGGNDDIYLIKYKPDYDAVNGQQVWAITPYDGGFNDYPSSVIFDAAGDVIVIGRTFNIGGDSDIFISKYSGVDGSLMAGWPYIKDSGYGHDGLNSVAVDDSGNIYVAGYVSNSSGNLDWYINKFSAAGAPLWGPNGKVINGTGDAFDEATSIAVDINDDEIIVGGTLTSLSGSQDLHLVRFQADGTERWQKTLDRHDVDDYMVGMAVSPSGDICIVGGTNNGIDSDVVAVTYNFQGVIIGSTIYDSGFDDEATSIAVNKFGEFYIAGFSASGPSAQDDYDFVVFKFEGEDLQAPSPLQATVHHTSVDLSWTENDPTITNYQIFRQDGPCTVGGTQFPETPIYTASPSELSYTDSNGLTIGSHYCYGIRSYRQAGVRYSRTIEASVLTTVPADPTALTVEVLNSSDIKICWDDNTLTEDKFVIQRCTGAACDYTAIVDEFDAPAEPDPLAVETCYIDTTACDSGSGKTFRYQVKAVKLGSANNEGWSTGYAGPSADATTPDLAAPTGLIATRVAEAEVDLTWTDNSNDEDEFVIERCTGADCTYLTEIATVAAVPDNILHLGMDEAAWTGAPGEIADYSGLNNHGTAFGGVTTSTEGHTDNSADLDGIDDYLETPLVIDQSAQSTGVTMMAWVKPTTTSAGQHYLFSTENGSDTALNNNWGVLRNGTDWYVATGESVRGPATAVPADVDQWQHIAVVFSQSGIKLYKNGVSSSINFIGNHETSASLAIGRQGLVNQNFFDGLIDEAAVFNRALSTAEIQKIHSRGLFPETTGAKWFTDTTVAANTTYTYLVRARKLTTCGTTLAPTVSDPNPETVVVTTVPPPPDLTAVAVDAGQILLSWTPKTTTQTAFLIERCNGDLCTPVDVVDDTVAADATSFVDSSFCYGADGINRYQISATGPWGSSLPSTIAQTAITPLTAPLSLDIAGATESQVELSWVTEDSEADGFRILRCEGSSCSPATDVSGSPYLNSDPDLLGLWQMNDPSWDMAASVIDSSGKANHGTAVNGVTIDSAVTGRFGYGAAHFDGVNDYITTQTTLDTSYGSQGATFEAWVNPTRMLNDYQYVFSTSNSTNLYHYAWGLCYYNNRWYIDSGASRLYTAQLVETDTWNHMVLVYDPASGVTLYKNGVNIYSNTSIFADSPAPLTIGRRGTSGANYFQGWIDQAALYNRALTEQEVLQRYNGGNTPASTFHFIDTDAVTSGQSYTYKVLPHKNTTCGDLDDQAGSLQTTLTTPQPLPPSDLVSAATDTTTIELSWTPNTSSETEYILERCLGIGCTFTTIDQTFNLAAGSSSYTDSSVCQGQTYNYRIKAIQGVNWDTGFVTFPEIAAMAKQPPAITLTVVSESEVDISWSDPNIDEDAYTLSSCVYDPPTTECLLPTDFSTLSVEPGSVDGDLAHYRMNEESWNGTAGEVADISGNANNAQSYNGALTMDSDKPGFGKAGFFDGVNDYITTPVSINQSLSSTGATFEAWVKPIPASNNWRVVFSTENGGADWAVMHYNNRWYVADGSNWTITPHTVDLDQWQHIAVAFIPGTGIKFYKNGVAADLAIIEYDLNDNPLTIGKTGSSNSYFFAGYIDEVMVYDRPLSQNEVTTHFSALANNFQYEDTGLAPGATYHYKVEASKGASCGWTAETVQSTTTPPPAPPENLLIACSSTDCSLGWDEMNGSETGYKVSRCDGALSACAVPTVFDLPANSNSFIDDTVCPGLTYTYEVWAVGSWGSSTSIEDTKTTSAIPAAPTGLATNQISEVEIDVTWAYTAADEEGMKLERCYDATCDEIILPPGTTSYIDDELTAATEYCYRVAAYKSAICNSGWQTAWDGQVCITTDLAQSSLTATAVDTTSVGLAWTDAFKTETGSAIERCIGDMASCCPDGPQSCSGTFGQVDLVTTDVTDFTDTSACKATTYTYRINSESSGLSKANNGCWTMKAPVAFTQFKPFTGVELVINYQPEMNADFSDIRFYDETGNRELKFWLKEMTPSTSATVWLMTGDNNAINLYYGNASAGPASADQSLFTTVYDNFAGTDIDTGKWILIDQGAKITQSNGLNLNYNGSYRSWTSALISTATFERAAGNEIIYDFTIGTDNVYSYDNMAIGWEEDQTTDASTSGLMYAPYFTSYANHYIYGAYERGTGSLYTITPKVLYDDLTRYELKIVLLETGAQYYLRGGRYQDWLLMREVTTSYPSDDVLRIGIHNHTMNAVIHSITLKQVSAAVGASVDFPNAVGDGITCLSFSHTWSGAYSLASESTTPDADSPSGLTATAADGTVVLNWTANSSDETEFRVERDCGTGFSQIGTSATGVTTYTDTQNLLIDGASCSYQVIAHKETSCAWTTLPSQPITVLGPPEAPTGVTANPANSFQIELLWSPSPGATGYEIEVEVFNGAWVPVANLDAAFTTYLDSSGINPGAFYTYRIRAYRDGVYSGYTTVTTPIKTPGYDGSATTCPPPAQ